MLYALLEKAINHILKSDPDTEARLGKLQGKVVKVTFTDWQIDSYLLIQPQGVRLTGAYEGLVDTTIRGDTLGLLRMGWGIEVTGDLDLGEKIRDILRKVDIDGEEYLSRFVGDATAHAVAWRAKRSVEVGKQAWRGLRENIREFCEVEAQYLPSRGQVENFYHDVAHLRDDVDRAAARVERIAARYVKEDGN